MDNDAAKGAHYWSIDVRKLREMMESVPDISATFRECLEAENRHDLAVIMDELAHEHRIEKS